MRAIPEWMTAATMVREGYTLEEVEWQVRRYAVQWAVNREKGCLVRAGLMLGVHRNTVGRMVKEYGVVVRGRSAANPRQ